MHEKCKSRSTGASKRRVSVTSAAGAPIPSRMEVAAEASGTASGSGYQLNHVK